MPEILTLPPLIDMHIHAREPGQEDKENFFTVTRAALAGGVTMVFDMPNKRELVTSKGLLDRERELARVSTHNDIGFYLGTLCDEDQNFFECMDDVYGVKIYMNNTTGGFIVNDPIKLDSFFRRYNSPKPILVHAEGDTLSSAISLAEKYHRRLHVCHVSLASELDQIRKAKDKRGEKIVTCEVTPQHLFESSLWSADPGHKLKPPFSWFDDMLALWKGVEDGTIDLIATDHAPHTITEKHSNACPSGVPGLETTLAVLLMAERDGRISIDKIKKLTHYNPTDLFNLPKQPDTYIEVLRGVPYEIRGANLETKSHQTPFEGRTVFDKVDRVILRGQLVYAGGKVLAAPGSGKIL